MTVTVLLYSNAGFWEDEPLVHKYPAAQDPDTAVRAVDEQ